MKIVLDTKANFKQKICKILPTNKEAKYMYSFLFCN